MAKPPGTYATRYAIPGGRSATGVPSATVTPGKFGDSAGGRPSVAGRLQQGPGTAGGEAGRCCAQVVLVVDAMVLIMEL